MSEVILDHVVAETGWGVRIEVMDKPQTPGNMCHQYMLSLQNPDAEAPRTGFVLNFQNGPINEVGVNGLTHEALLAVILHRLRGAQEGPYKCKDNAMAITHIEEAMNWLHRRTLARIRRGVEGTHAI